MQWCSWERVVTVCLAHARVSQPRWIVGQLGPDVHLEASSLNILRRVVEAGAGDVDIVEDGRARDEAGDQAVAVARVGFVARIVARNADEDGGAVAAHLDRRAAGPDVLVVVFEPRNVPIVAEAARSAERR